MKKNNPVVETAVYYPGARNMAKLTQQFNWDEHLKEVLWTKIVSQKIKNQIAVLDNYHLDKDDVQSELD
ncbi:MAG: hypothetical protein M3Z47_08285, partial [Gilliamella apis]|nr:hypothetical protein [Gilliamella apis]